MYTKGQMVHPDKRKGQVYLYQADDSLMHFCWKDRTTGTVEEDLIIFPDDCEYKRVPQCTTGRVYVLKFKSSSRKLFFWMQEPKTDKDEEHSRKVNELINNPPAPGSQRSTGSTPNQVLSNDISNLRDSDIQNLFGNISQQQLMQILGSGMSSLANLLGPGSGGSGGGGGGHGSSGSNSTSATTTASTTPAATTTPTPAPTPAQDSTRAGSGNESSSTTPAPGSVHPIQLSDLQNILSGISVPPDASGSPRLPVDLSSAMTAEALQPILTNENFVNALKPYLPATADELPPTEQLRGTVTSPQFQQAVSLFSSALQSGQLGPLINQFGLGEDAVLAASSCDMEAFIKALGKKKSSDEGSKKEEEKKKADKDTDQDKDEDDSMSVD
ncbi:proteasomal ubiquitin receptor ADRM1-B-like isoform X2 [Macrobrachium nipponense]